MKSFSIGQLAVWVHETPNPPPARVLLVHGLGEHSARHLNTIDSLVKMGLEVVRFDLRGCGKSGGDAQWIESFEDYIDDCTQVANWIWAELPPRPLYLMGHSLGGCISIHFAARYISQLEGLVLSAPAYRVGTAISPITIAVGRVVEKFFPKTRIPKNTDAHAISRDPEVIEAYDNDPMVARFNTLRQGAEILKAMEAVGTLAHQLALPLAIFHGSGDTIIRLDGSFDIILKAPSKDRELTVLPGVYHEPHNDYGREIYFDLLTRWLKKRILPTDRV